MEEKENSSDTEMKIIKFIKIVNQILGFYIYTFLK